MVNIDDLWVGDKLVLKKSRRIGTFEGKTKDGRARILYHNKIIISNAANLARYEEPPEKVDLSWIDKGDSKPIGFLDDQIDLHIENLRPDIQPDQLTNTLSTQIKAFQTYLAEAKETGLEFITIIHGKGEGVLKSEIIRYIQQDPEVVWFQEVNDGGALQIKLQTSY